FQALFGEWKDDEHRLGGALLYAFPNQPENISSEGDVTRVYHQQISSPVRAAWTYPRIFERNQVGPMGNTSFSGTVDCSFTYGNSCILIGELKSSGTVGLQWTDSNKSSTNKSRLGKELRGYAYHYNCPQTFCYDGLHLLILRFRASSREDIKQCQADCWVVPTSSTATTSSIRYAFYCLLSEGFHRVVSQIIQHHAVNIGHYQRRFEWFSGKPCW
ncbi:hypothetical protein GQ43DRAFT_356632, partial [Delitschia confertaspora ATCC 74209]